MTDKVEENAHSFVTRRNDLLDEELDKEIAELEKQNLEQSNKNTSEVDVEEEDKKKVQSPLPKSEEVNNDDDLSAEEKNFKKRYGDLRRHSQKKEQEFLAKIEELNKKLEAAPSTMPTDEEEIKKWVENNPKAAAIVKALAGEEVSRTSKELSTKLEKLEKDREEISKEKAIAKIKEKHGDFDDLVNGDSLHDWVGTKPDFIQNALYDGGPDEVIEVLDLYKQFLKKPDNGKQAATQIRTNKGADLESSTGAKYSESMVSKMSAAEYDKNEDAIMEAMASGKFVYDLSGGAR